MRCSLHSQCPLRRCVSADSGASPRLSRGLRSASTSPAWLSEQGAESMCPVSANTAGVLLHRGVVGAECAVRRGVATRERREESHLEGESSIQFTHLAPTNQRGGACRAKTKLRPRPRLRAHPGRRTPQARTSGRRAAAGPACRKTASRPSWPSRSTVRTASLHLIPIAIAKGARGARRGSARWPCSWALP